MKKIIFAIFIQLLSSISFAQGGWTWTEKANLPMPTSNNGLASAIIGDTTYVYSFAGITSGKQYSDIHSKAFKYNTLSNIWDSIPDLPDSLGGLIALSANTINNKIYIVGGYHVYSNSNEVSSNEIFEFDPITETYSKLTKIPIAIDDHVSCVFKDSLLYIITGWSSDVNPDANINAVQIFNPTLNTWSVGTSTPQTNSFMSFGASGSIIGNTIYYAGGAQNTTFTLRNELRKGVINPINPTEITWSIDTITPNEKLYRAGSIAINEKLFWIGGASIPYNYDGLSYSSNLPVQPTDRILEYFPSNRSFYENSPTSFEVMDIRNIAKISATKFIIAGGILKDTLVSDKTFLLEYDTTFSHPVDTTAIDTEALNSDIIIFPNPSTDFITIQSKNFEYIEIRNLQGQTLLKSKEKKIDITSFTTGIYLIILQNIDSSKPYQKIIVKN